MTANDSRRPTLAPRPWPPPYFTAEQIADDCTRPGLFEELAEKTIDFAKLRGSIAMSSNAATVAPKPPSSNPPPSYAIAGVPPAYVWGAPAATVTALQSTHVCTLTVAQLQELLYDAERAPGRTISLAVRSDGTFEARAK